MKKFLFLIAVPFLLFSCKDDEDDLNIENSYYKAEMGTAMGSFNALCNFQTNNNYKIKVSFSFQGNAGSMFSKGKYKLNYPSVTLYQDSISQDGSTYVEQKDTVVGSFSSKEKLNVSIPDVEYGPITLTRQ